MWAPGDPSGFGQTPPRLIRVTQQLRQPRPIVRDQAEHEGEPRDLLYPAEALLDPLSEAEGDRVPGVLGGAGVDARAAGRG